MIVQNQSKQLGREESRIVYLRKPDGKALKVGISKYRLTGQTIHGLIHQQVSPFSNFFASQGNPSSMFKLYHAGKILQNDDVLIQTTKTHIIVHVVQIEKEQDQEEIQEQNLVGIVQEQSQGKLPINQKKKNKVSVKFVILSNRTEQKPLGNVITQINGRQKLNQVLFSNISLRQFMQEKQLEIPHRIDQFCSFLESSVKLYSLGRKIKTMLSLFQQDLQAKQIQILLFIDLESMVKNNQLVQVHPQFPLSQSFFAAWENIFRDYWHSKYSHPCQITEWNLHSPQKTGLNFLSLQKTQLKKPKLTVVDRKILDSEKRLAQPEQNKQNDIDSQILLPEPSFFRVELKSKNQKQSLEQVRIIENNFYAVKQEKNVSCVF